MSFLIKQLKTEGVHCSVIEHGMTSLSFQTAVQKNEAKLSFFAQFENEIAPGCALLLNKSQLPMF